jgi:hypothetical protein
MAIKSIAYSYWRRIKAKARTYASVPASIKTDILILAGEDLNNNIISQEEYNTLITE